MRKNAAGRDPSSPLPALCFSLLLALLLSGCVPSSATPIAYISPEPPEKTCTLRIIGTLTVTNFDGEQVEWKAGGFDAWASVQIPAGRHTFTLDFDRYANGRRQYRNGITLSYDSFVVNHTYEMVAAAGAEAGGFSGLFTNMLGAMRDTVNRTLRIGIRDTTIGQDDFTWLAWK
jgi:hypothetical protein